MHEIEMLFKWLFYKYVLIPLINHLTQLSMPLDFSFSYYNLLMLCLGFFSTLVKKKIINVCLKSISHKWYYCNLINYEHKFVSSLYRSIKSNMNNLEFNFKTFSVIWRKQIYSPKCQETYVLLMIARSQCINLI